MAAARLGAEQIVAFQTSEQEAPGLQAHPERGRGGGEQGVQVRRSGPRQLDARHLRRWWRRWRRGARAARPRALRQVRTGPIWCGTHLRTCVSSRVRSEVTMHQSPASCSRRRVAGCGGAGLSPEPPHSRRERPAPAQQPPRKTRSSCSCGAASKAALEATAGAREPKGPFPPGGRTRRLYYQDTGAPHARDAELRQHRCSRLGERPWRSHRSCGVCARGGKHSDT